MTDDKLSTEVQDALERIHAKTWMDAETFNIINDELRRLTAENAELRARAEKAEAELARWQKATVVGSVIDGDSYGLTGHFPQGFPAVGTLYLIPKDGK